MADVVVVGSYNAGMTIHGDRLPQRGETVIGDRFASGPGGKGANQAIGAKRLGADVLLISKVGSDALGNDARTTLLREGLPAHGILTGDDPTGVAMILVDAAGDNVISIAPGANLQLTSTDVLGTFQNDLQDCRFLLFQLECRAELALDVAQWGKSQGVGTILNPAPARPLPREALRLFDVMTPNETELREFGRTLGLRGDLEDLALELVQLGMRDIVVTLGEKGALWASAAGLHRFPALSVTAVDTTGAGDAFNAGLVAGLANSYTMESAIENGCRAGAYCVTRRGVIDGLATRDELEAFSSSLVAQPAYKAASP